MDLIKSQDQILKLFDSVLPAETQYASSIEWSDSYKKNKIVILSTEKKRKVIVIDEKKIPVYFTSETDFEGEIMLFFEDGSAAAYYSKELNSIALRFDPVRSSQYLISLEYEEESPLDKYGRVISRENVLYEDLSIPSVNYYAKILKSAYGYLKTEKFIFNSEDKFYVLLTHDIDYLSSWRLFLLARSFQLLLKLKIVFSMRTFLRVFGRSNPYLNCIGDFEKAEAEKDARSVYFFLTDSGNFLKAVFKKSGTVFVEKTGWLFERLKKSGNSLALHTSFYANKDPNKMMEEKMLLEKFLGEKVTSNRQHYINMVFPESWISSEKAGIENDFSMGFFDSCRFRGGITVPFHPLTEGESLKITAFPLNFMDRTYTKYIGNKVSSEKDLVNEIIGHIKFTGGLFTLLWHNINCEEGGFEKGLEKYTEILDLLKSQNAEFTDIEQLKKIFNV
ncbi:hypothetical protein JXL83_04450 [candidate division WOR-3 bacterium]|nr:hypothetical protein [candidate division WOR-3 bacterium]